MTVQRQKFSSRVDSELLAALRELARSDGRRFNAVLEEAMRKYVATRVEQKLRPSVMAHFEASLEKNRRLGETLASGRSVNLNGWRPVHPTARLQEGVSLRREDMYEERM